MTTTTARPREGAMGRRERSERIARAIVADYERVRGSPRSPEYRVAYARLVARVRHCGGWIQVAGLRYIWSRSEGAIIRQPIGRGRTMRFTEV